MRLQVVSCARGAVSRRWYYMGPGLGIVHFEECRSRRQEDRRVRMLRRVSRSSLVFGCNYLIVTSFSGLFTATEAHDIYFGPQKTARLEAIKRKWDPKDVFDYPHGF